jgi:ATP-dependent protease HslVU (ClpYQ) peptidase subunit
VLGSVSDTVLRHSECPLAIIRQDTALAVHGHGKVLADGQM